MAQDCGACIEMLHMFVDVCFALPCLWPCSCCAFTTPRAPFVLGQSQTLKKLKFSEIAWSKDSTNSDYEKHEEVCLSKHTVHDLWTCPAHSSHPSFHFAWYPPFIHIPSGKFCRYMQVKKSASLTAVSVKCLP